MPRHLIFLLPAFALVAVYIGYGTGSLEWDPMGTISHEADSPPETNRSIVSEGIVLVDTIEGVDDGGLFRFDTMRAEVRYDDGVPAVSDFYTFTFPLVRSSRHPSVGQRITEDLWNRVSDSGKYLNVFAGVVPERWSGDVSLSFEVVWQNRHLLVIRITGEGCGAYCENWEQYFTYETDSGNAVTPATLMTEEGQEWIAWDSYQRARRTIVDYLAYLEENRSNDDSSRVAEQIDLYRYCLNARYNDHGTEEEFRRHLESTGEAAWPEFRIVNDTIFLSRERCSNHAMRALDDLWDNVQGYAITELAPYLTDVGKGYFRD